MKKISDFMGTNGCYEGFWAPQQAAVVVFKGSDVVDMRYLNDAENTEMNALEVSTKIFENMKNVD